MAANRDAMKNAALAGLGGGRNGRGETQDDMAAALLGEVRRGEGGRVTAAPISIYTIYPDATQPRRALPTAVRQSWDGNPTSLPALFMEWMRALDGWRSLIVAVLNGEETERPEEIPANVGALLEIADLAASIRRDGLTNPITVVRNGDDYVIETGERRWLAYHLLVAHTGDERWTKIPARVVEQFNRWRQAAENNTRQDLNAIGKARQLAVLLMELLQNAHEFQPLNAFEHEQDFYAQVSDGEAFRTPRGKGQLLLNATGLSHADQIRQYRALLRLPRDLWDDADDGNWSIAEVNQYRDSNHANDDDLSQTDEKSKVRKKKPTPPPVTLSQLEMTLNDFQAAGSKTIDAFRNADDKDPRWRQIAETMIDDQMAFLLRLKDDLRRKG